MVEYIVHCQAGKEDRWYVIDRRQAAPLIVLVQDRPLPCFIPSYGITVLSVSE